MVVWVQPTNTTKRIVTTTLLGIAMLTTLFRLRIRIRTRRFWLDDVCEYALSLLSMHQTIWFCRGHCCSHFLNHVARLHVAEDNPLFKQAYADCNILASASVVTVLSNPNTALRILSFGFTSTLW
jgi:hypothetical protein